MTVCQLTIDTQELLSNRLYRGDPAFLAVAAVSVEDGSVQVGEI